MSLATRVEKLFTVLNQQYATPNLKREKMIKYEFADKPHKVDIMRAVKNP